MQLEKALFVAVFSVFGRCVSAVCPAAYVDLGTGCYHFTTQDQLTWQQAYFICALELNGYLAEIESAQEQNNIGVYLDAVVDPGKVNSWWIGGTDILAEGTFRWMTSGNEFTYTAWRNGQPDDTYDNEDYVHLEPGTHTWNDLESANSENFNFGVFKAICETNAIE